MAESDKTGATANEKGTTGRRYSYAAAGVDIAAGNALVKAIKPAAASTRRPGADAALGGFGAVFDLAAAGYRDPLLVAGTDGVGTKLKVAAATGNHGGIGIDLVAMCANDVLVQGAEPLFFLDYFATAALDPEHAAEVIEGIAEGCRQAGCALIGGETAEMPGLYAAGDYDLAGFVVGAVERDGLLTGDTIAPGDVVLGIASSGVHANGLSLVRRLIADYGLSYVQPAPFDSRHALGEILLRPTRIYVRSLLPLIRQGRIRGLAHVTGGGLLENVPRTLPAGTRAVIDADRWPLPPVFAWLKELGHLEAGELARTFNCGIGMVAIVAADKSTEVCSALEACGETVWPIGRIEDRDGGPALQLEGSPGTWGESGGFHLAGGSGEL